MEDVDIFGSVGFFADVDDASCVWLQGAQIAVAAESPERMGVPVSSACKNLRRRLERYFSLADFGGTCPALFGQFLEHDPVVSKMRQITSSF